MICYIFSCKKNDAIKKDTVQVEAADSLKASPGINRIRLSWEVSDPAVKKAVIVIDNSDSVVVPREAGDTMSLTLTKLGEGNHSFSLYLYDAAGHSSGRSKVVGRVYGSQYIQSALPWALRDVTFYDEKGELVIGWSKPELAALGGEVEYTDTLNAVQLKRVPADSDITVLKDYKPGASFKYRTLYLPEPDAIDTFFTGYQTKAVAGGSLKNIADKKGILIGSLISYGAPWSNSDGVILDQSPNGIYTTIAEKEFNLGTATWGAGWGGWTSESTYDFTNVNVIINWCKANNQKVIMHNILGSATYMPDWFNNGSFTPKQLNTFLKDLIDNFMDSNDNKDKVDIWDVANELFNNDGTYRDMRWNDMGWEDDASGLAGADKVNDKHPAFIGKALEYCREKTNALLEIRDYGIEDDDPKAKYYRKHLAFYQLMKHLQAKGYPVNCVGIQAHRNIGSTYEGGMDAFRSTIEKFRNAGLKVDITELDISSDTAEQWTSAVAEEQKVQYYNIIKAAVEGGADVINFWGFRDNNDPNWRVDQHPLIFDHDYNKKPAYYGVRDALFDAK
jgi:endo-1,4-beta-xylanase